MHPIIDPGTTVIDSTGKPLLSPKAVHISPVSQNMPAPQDSAQNLQNQRMPVPNQGLNNPQNPQNPQMTPVAPTPQSLGQNNLVKATDPNAIQQDLYSQMPQRDDPKYKLQHPIRHALLAALEGGLIGASGRSAGPIYQDMKDKPFNQAMSDWQNKMKEIEPLARTQQESKDRTERVDYQNRSLASQEKNRESEEQTRQQTAELAQQKQTLQELKEAREAGDIQRATALKEKAETDAAAYKKTRDALEEKRLTLAEKTEADRVKHMDAQDRTAEERANKTAKSESAGNWEPLVNPETGKLAYYNSKLGQWRDDAAGPAPKSVVKPAEYNREQAKLAPVQVAYDVANEYVKSGKYTGSGDFDLILKFFELARTQGLRINNAELNKAFTARSWPEGIKVLGTHASKGRYLDNTQMKEILDVINLEAKARGITSSKSRSSGPVVNNPNKPKTSHVLPEGL